MFGSSSYSIIVPVQDRRNRLKVRESILAITKSCIIKVLTLVTIYFPAKVGRRGYIGGYPLKGWYTIQIYSIPYNLINNYVQYLYIPLPLVLRGNIWSYHLNI